MGAAGAAGQHAAEQAQLVGGRFGVEIPCQDRRIRAVTGLLGDELSQGTDLLEPDRRTTGLVGQVRGDKRQRTGGGRDSGVHRDPALGQAPG
ncbi:MAG TPA: hypothetical protein VJS67_06615, partial [Pseudonocardiaceae bacterium]|nr:hypothetical protein [Pseudonocardiaceae bacterium]